MLNTSVEYANGMVPSTTARRETKVRITAAAINQPLSAIGWDSLGADPQTRIKQVSDQIYNTQLRIASGELNRWTLDGQTVVQPDVDQVHTQIGYVTLEVGESWASPFPFIEVTSDYTGIIDGFSVIFDTVGVEYPPIFDVYIEYGTSLNTTISVTDHASPIYTYFGEFEDPTLIRVILKSWSQVGHKGRVSEITFGVVEQFGGTYGEPLLSVNVIDEVDLTTETLPYGELSFTFYDQSGDFNLLYPGDRTKIFTLSSSIQVELAVRTAGGYFEYQQIATFRFSQWLSDEVKIVTVKGVDLIGFVTDKLVREPYGGRSQTNSADVITSFVYDPYGLNLDPTVNVSIDPAIFPSTGTDFQDGPYAETAQKELIRIAQWGCAIPYVDYRGVIMFGSLDTVAGSSIPIEQMFEGIQVERYKEVAGIRVYYYSYAKSVDTFEISSITGVFGTGTTLEIDIGYDFTDLVATGSGGATVDWELGFASGINTVGVSGTGTITITAKKWIEGRLFVEAPNTVATDPAAQWIDIENPHICTLSKATEVAAWLLAIYQRIAKVQFDWRGTPVIEVLDPIEVEPESSRLIDGIVDRQEWTHDGALEYHTRVVGMWLHGD